MANARSGETNNDGQKLFKIIITRKVKIGLVKAGKQGTVNAHNSLCPGEAGLR